MISFSLSFPSLYPSHAKQYQSQKNRKTKERRYLGLSIQTYFPFFTHNSYFFVISIVINKKQIHF
ncbi:hypothetical protein PanWU01x14_068040 [Parasponia andersonii]|uniref:Uncharacterized protein n=1 Tax=Parasponia andersonii TaxID=3476 RepID=A0A2P5DF93_PARAD|nr:hypothetical protein PanWU01x14_068040 [Parasponia andersonii]